MSTEKKRGRAARSTKPRGRVDDGRKVVGYNFRPYRDLPDGRRLWARTYGLKAWPIPIYADEVPEVTPSSS